MSSNSGVYGIYADGELVYVGQSRNLLFRMNMQIRAIANGRGLAGVFPEVFEGRIASVKVIEYVDEGTVPPNPRYRLRYSDPTFQTAMAVRRKWEQDLKERCVNRELFHIQTNRPRCNKRGITSAGKRLTISDVEALRVTPPVAPRTSTTTLAITA